MTNKIIVLLFSPIGLEGSYIAHMYILYMPLYNIYLSKIYKIYLIHWYYTTKNLKKKNFRSLGFKIDTKIH